MANDEHDNGRPPETAENGASGHCATCGTRLAPGRWHPTIGHTDTDGAYRIIRFCSDECRDDWRTTHEESEDT